MPPADWDQVAERIGRTASRRDLRARAIHAEVLRLAGPVQGRRTLDVGCGAGALVRVLAERGARAVGVDSSPQAIAEAQREAAEAGLERAAELLVADLDAPRSVPEGPFDLITGLALLEEQGATAGQLELLARRLRPRGRLILAGRHPYLGEGPGGSPRLQKLFARLRQVGLRVVDLREPRGPDRQSSFLVLLCERRRRQRKRLR